MALFNHSTKRRFLALSFLGLILALAISGIILILASKTMPKKNIDQNIPTSTRKPAVAGQFYPANPDELEKKLENYLSQAKTISAEGDLKILVVPHAGLDFSGPVAGAGFKQITRNYSRVILLGASHQVPFSSAAIYPKGAWETPLGTIQIDEEAAQKIVDENLGLLPDPSPHQEEHSLEIELPFLQRVLKDFKIIPILIGQPPEEVLDHLAQKIADLLDKNTLLVVSTDLSHYPPYEVANQVDRQTIEAILSGNPEELEKTISKIEKAQYPGLDTCACGYDPLWVALRVSQILKIKEAKEIKYQNSGDISGDKSRVVGYGAIGFWQNNNYEKEALALARQTLKAHLSGLLLPSFSPESAELFKKLGAFVTLKKKGELRGCIGEFEPDKPLYMVIQDMAIAAATEDPRFPKVLPEELDEIKIEISVMSPRKKIDDWKKIELGKHGVVVQSGAHAGTFLPQVATETGWSKEEFLEQLCRQKAGLPAHCYQSPGVNLYVFEVTILEER